MRNSTLIGRVAAIAAVAIAIIAVAVILLQGGSSYTVKAVFVNASQIVSGDLVEVSGNSIGTVSDISLTPQGQAQLTLDITNSQYQPLRQGTQATVREASLSGIANRYVDLRLGPATGAAIRSGGTLPTTETTSAVDLDQLFNTLDAPTRKGLQDVIQGSASQYSRQGKAIAGRLAVPQPGNRVLEHAVQQRSTATPGGLRTSSSSPANLVSDVAQRSADLSGLIQHLSSTTEALAAQRTALGQSLQELPPFMRLANTTFVNLRSALDDVTPLVDASKPVAPKLRKLLEQLKPLAEDSVPTVRDLSNIVSRPGAYNDLIELTKLGVPLAGATVRTINANGQQRSRRVPAVDDRAQQLHPGARDRASVRGRSDRLVRGLHAPGDDRCQRRLEPGRAGGRGRLDPERHAQPPRPAADQPAAAHAARIRRQRHDEQHRRSA